jgi:hypothetical protein
MLRPGVSSFHTTSVSPSRTYAISSARPGRSPLARDMVSENAFDTLTLASASFCRSRVWATVETPLRNHAPVDAGSMAPKCWNHRFETFVPETNLSDRSTWPNGARSGRVLGVSNVVYFKTNLGVGDCRNQRKLSP